MGLNHEQRNVVLNGAGKVVVLAPFGTGKTTTMVERGKKLIRQGALAAEMVILTFTKALAAEIHDKIVGAIGPDALDVFVGTFHSYALRMYLRFTAGQNVQVLDRDAQNDLIEKIMVEAAEKSVGIRDKISRKQFPDAKALSDMFSYCENMECGLAEALSSRSSWVRWLKALSGIEFIRERYRAFKAANGMMDFDDMPRALLELMQTNPSVARQLAMEARWVMVDEFQDCNGVQIKLLLKLSAIHGNLMVIGDDMQSIYGFRGADFRHIRRFAQDPEFKFFRLRKVYRGTGEIVRFGAKLAESCPHAQKRELVSVRRKGLAPRVIMTESAEAQGEWVARKIRDLTASGLRRFSDMSVLYRADYHAWIFEEAFRKAGIPYTKEGSPPLWNQETTLKFAAWVKLLTIKTDAKVWAEVVRALATGIENWQTMALRSNPLAWDLISAMSHCSSIHELKRFLEEMIAAVSSGKIGGALQNWCMEKGVRAKEESPWETRRKIEFLSMSIDRSESPSQWVDLAGSNYRDSEEGANRGVTLSTIHSAKGLEWPVVFVGWALDGVFPSVTTSLENKEMHEEHRLAYVAATRAKDQLFLVRPTAMFDEASGCLLTETTRFFQQ